MDKLNQIKEAGNSRIVDHIHVIKVNWLVEYEKAKFIHSKSAKLSYCTSKSTVNSV